MGNLAMQQYERFSEIVEQFCELVDLVDSLSSRQFVSELARLLSALYFATVDLPEVDFKVDFEEVLDDQDWWSKVHNQVGNKLGPFNFYWEIFDPHKQQSPIPVTIGDDIADIYVELKRCLILWKERDPEKWLVAAGKWRLGFYVHWGAHLTDALRALHRVIIKYYEIENGMA